MTTVRSQKEEIQLAIAITITRKISPFFKSVSPVFGVAPLSMKPGWLRYALFVLAKELILCLYLQMRLILTMSANQLVWASHSNPSIPRDKEREREKLSGSKIKDNVCILWQTKKGCKHCNYYWMYLGLGYLFFKPKRAKNATWIVIRRNISTTSDISALQEIELKIKAKVAVLKTCWLAYFLQNKMN